MPKIQVSSYYHHRYVPTYVDVVALYFSVLVNCVGKMTHAEWFQSESITQEWFLFESIPE